MGHDGPNGDIKDRVSARALGYSHTAENVARARTAGQVVEAWMNSPQHRAHILDCTFTETGLDSERNRTSNEVYWTQTFGG